MTTDTLGPVVEELITSVPMNRKIGILNHQLIKQYFIHKPQLLRRKTRLRKIINEKNINDYTLEDWVDVHALIRASFVDSLKLFFAEGTPNKLNGAEGPPLCSKIAVTKSSILCTLTPGFMSVYKECLFNNSKQRTLLEHLQEGVGSLDYNLPTQNMVVISASGNVIHIQTEDIVDSYEYCSTPDFGEEHPVGRWMRLAEALSSLILLEVNFIPYLAKVKAIASQLPGEEDRKEILDLYTQYHASGGDPEAFKSLLKVRFCELSKTGMTEALKRYKALFKDSPSELANLFKTLTIKSLFAEIIAENPGSVNADGDILDPKRLVVHDFLSNKKRDGLLVLDNYYEVVPYQFQSFEDDTTVPNILDNQEIVEEIYKMIKRGSV